MRIIRFLLTPVVKTVSLLNSISAKIITFTLVKLVGRKQLDRKTDLSRKKSFK